ncbi:MAG TPA: hypothetical protein VNV66_00345 [Pilimelia sp.]|nr:hypothetical protein [Pilimelia sp.]
MARRTDARPASGYRIADPKLVRGTAGIYRLDPGSPAIGAVGTWVSVTHDMDGQARPLRRSIGADEVVAAPVTRDPLTVGSVGPAAARHLTVA